MIFVALLVPLQSAAVAPSASVAAVKANLDSIRLWHYTVGACLVVAVYSSAMAQRAQPGEGEQQKKQRRE